MDTKSIALTILMAAALTMAACSSPETPSEAPSSAPTPDTPSVASSAPEELRQQRSGDYIVTLLSESGDLKQGANRLILEFRNASTNELTAVTNVEVKSSMPMKGMAPMMGTASVKPSDTPGRYELSSEMAMMGDWEIMVMFAGNQKVQFMVKAQ